LDRAAWEQFMETLVDRESVEKTRAQIAAIGKDEFVRLSYTAAEVDRMLDDGAAALTILRGRAELTQAQLASLAGVSQSYVAEIESGKKPGSLATLRKLAKALNIPVTYGHHTPSLAIIPLARAYKGERSPL